MTPTYVADAAVEEERHHRIGDPGGARSDAEEFSLVHGVARAPPRIVVYCLLFAVFCLLLLYIVCCLLFYVCCCCILLSVVWLGTTQDCFALEITLSRVHILDRMDG